MKKITANLSFVLLMCYIVACVGSYESREHTLQSVVDGNTVRMSDGVTVDLLGVEDTPAAAEYLQQLIGSKVRVRTDKSMPFKSKKQTVYAYITLKDKKLSVNAEILKQKLSTLNLTYVDDSLSVFQRYADEQFVSNNTPKSLSSGNNSSKTPMPRVTYGETEQKYSPQELFKAASPAVFLVEVYDESNFRLGIGTGFFINAEGVGLSNYHVFDGGKRFRIKTKDGEVYEVGEILAQNADYDCVMFKVIPRNNAFPFLKITKDEVETGTEVFVLGNPKGLEQTLTKGIVSAMRNEQGVIQMDAAISPGSSGSPVMDISGNVIGIATFKRNECENCNFAINIKEVEKALMQ
jgi:serine protease Do